MRIECMPVSLLPFLAFRASGRGQCSARPVLPTSDVSIGPKGDPTLPRIEGHLLFQAQFVVQCARAAVVCSPRIHAFSLARSLPPAEFKSSLEANVGSPPARAPSEERGREVPTILLWGCFGLKRARGTNEARNRDPVPRIAGSFSLSLLPFLKSCIRSRIPFRVLPFSCRRQEVFAFVGFVG